MKHENFKVIKENWDLVNSESPIESVEELFGFGKSRQDKWARIAGGDDVDVAAPLSRAGTGAQEYPAQEFAQVKKALEDANTLLNNPVDNKEIHKDLEKLLSTQNFIIKEEEGILLGQDLVLDLTKAPTLKKLIDAAKAKPEILQAIEAQLTRAGFKSVGATSAVPPAPAVPPPAATAVEVGDTIPLSGTEMKLMQNIAQVKGTHLNKVINQTVRNLGAALKQPQIQQIVQKFNKSFYPQFNNLVKRANIAVAEGIQLEELSKRQQAHKKGKLRQGKAAMRYFKSVGGKPPLLVTQLVAALRETLINNVSVDTLLDAAAELEGQTKNPEEKEFINTTMLDMLQNQPAKRLQLYKQNVDTFIEEIAKIAIEAIKAAVGTQSRASRLPENIQESKTFERWKTIAGIK